MQVVKSIQAKDILLYTGKFPTGQAERTMAIKCVECINNFSLVQVSHCAATSRTLGEW